MPSGIELGLSLRQAGLADAPVLALVGAATFLESFAGKIPGDAILANCAQGHSPAAWQTLMAQPTTTAWLVELPPAAAPIGYAALTAKPDFPADLLQHGDYELKRLYVFSRFHGTGAGQRLMSLAIEHATKAGGGRLLLGVHPDNVRALSFYERNGFRKVGQRAFRLGDHTFLDPVLALTLR